MTQIWKGNDHHVSHRQGLHSTNFHLKKLGNRTHAPHRQDLNKSHRQESNRTKCQVVEHLHPKQVTQTSLNTPIGHIGGSSHVPDCVSDA